MNPYKVLKVDRKASAKEITAAYQQQRAAASGKRLDEVFDAYAILGDPRLRAEYDRGHVVGTGRAQVQRRGPRRSGAPRWVQVVVVLVIFGMLATVVAGLL